MVTMCLCNIPVMTYVPYYPEHRTVFNNGRLSNQLFAQNRRPPSLPANTQCRPLLPTVNYGADHS